MSTGKSIKLFLADGSPGGIITAEIMNWTGHVPCRAAFAPGRSRAHHRSAQGAPQRADFRCCYQPNRRPSGIQNKTTRENR